MFSKLFSTLKEHLTKKNIILGLLILTSSFAFVDYGFANRDVTAPLANGKADERTQSSTAVKGINEAIKGLASFLGVLTALITLFMHPGWYNGDIFNINTYLQQIWILMSNVVYFVFAVIIIVIAFMNIIGRGGDTYGLKKALPKFVVGILIVPFSWFIVQFIVSLSSVLAAAVLSLPFDSFKDNPAMSGFMSDFKFKTECIFTIGSPKGAKQEGGGEAKGKEAFECGKEKTIKELMDIEDPNGGTKQGIFGIISIYTYGILKVDQMDKVSLDNITKPGGITNLINLGTKAIFSVVFIIVYLILLFALFLALFVRGAQIWIYMMISPLFGLFYFFGGSIGKLGKLSDFNLKNFISLAMMPVYVAAALSFGLLFISVINYGMMQPANKGGIVDCKGAGESQNCVLDLGGFKLTINGAFGDSGTDGQKNLGTSPIGYLIMQMFAIVVLWTTVMAALKSSELTKSIIAPFDEFGKSVGSMAMKLPTYAPIPGTNFSANTLGTIGREAGQKLETTMSGNSRKWMKDNGFKALLSENADLNDRLRAQMNDTDKTKVKTNTNEILTNHKNYDEILQNKTAKEYLSTQSGINITGHEDLLKALKKIDENLGGRGQISNGGLDIRSINDKASLNKIIGTGSGNSTPPVTPTPQASPVKPVTIPGGSNPINVTVNTKGDLDKSERDKLQAAITAMPATSRPTQSSMKKALTDAGLDEGVAETIAKGLIP